ncbi:hypothetical protein SRB5_41760 [Streptomyces sp. RB5]|uniref:VWFA domain-containing protein n=1 Tax=Streptomyces smaragdinus TaxID=2585196 RepID=A0A7K0CKI4_9ACTN|nr:VWA domain-containing protein [Streptomyces smaragdinus]MQY14015.1 hypothetical protein [Streptomyces smaragdinus]
MTSAISLTKVESSAPSLVSLYKKAGHSLSKRKLAGERAAVYLVLDRSGSMRPFYRDGTVQHLAEQVLGLAAHLDDDGRVPVVFFSTDVDGTGEVSLDGYTGRIQEMHDALGHMGRTNYHWGMDAVLDLHLARAPRSPALVIFQTDGGPSNKGAAEKFLCKAAHLPLFWQFIGFGDPADNEFRFLHKLDDLAVPKRRPVDNAGFFGAGKDPRKVSDARMYDKLLAEFPQWLADARRAGIVAPRE